MSKTLVAYFSASNKTKKVAEEISKILDAKLFEIEPVEPYSDKDLDWNNRTSRTTLEAHDRTILPALKSKVNNIKNYDTVFIGFPIWWYTYPNIIDSFIEDNNLSGKIIVPFATSGGTGITRADQDLKNKLEPEGCEVLDGKLIRDSSKEKLEAWIKSLDQEEEED